MVESVNSTYPEECFFIAPIGDDDSEVRRRSDGVMRFIVQKAADELGLETVRADQIASPGQINLQVISHVLGARAAVADLTGLNPNVFYEMAVRHTAKLPLVIIAEKGTELPFDIAQMRTIFFDHKDLGDADLCRQAITKQLREAIENNVVDSPISTAVDLSALASGGAADRSIAELVTTVEGLSRAQREMIISLERNNLGPARVPPALLDDLYMVADSLRSANTDGSNLDVEELCERLDRAARFLDRRRERHDVRRFPKLESPEAGRPDEP